MISDIKTNKKDEDFWKNIIERLESTKEYLEKGFKIDEKEKLEILKQRAKDLSKEKEQKLEDEACIVVVEFLMGREKYAFELNYVREVYPLKDLTPLPCTPYFVSGIINIRSQIISLVDLKKFFELPEEGITNLNRIIILHSDDMEFGILADEILGVRSIETKGLQSSLPTISGIGAEYLKGITKDRVIILDGDKILSDPKIIVYEELAEN